MGGYGSGGHNKKNNELYSYDKIWAKTSIINHENKYYLRHGLDSKDITRQKCNFGGYRYYLICPKCNNKYTYLLKSNKYNDYKYLCRKCEGVTYTGQTVDTATRIKFKIDRLKKKLRRKPKYMHKTTYEKKLKEIDRLRDKHHYYWIKGAMKILGM